MLTNAIFLQNTPYILSILIAWSLALYLWSHDAASASPSGGRCLRNAQLLVTSAGLSHCLFSVDKNEKWQDWDCTQK
jgi:hypothetical protein